MIIVWNFEKASLSIRILKRDVSFKISDVKSVEKLGFENASTRILRREGWEINDLSPLSWQFFVKFHDLLLFKGLRVLKQIFVSRKLKYLNLISWNIRLFWILSFAKDVFNCRKLIVFSCLQFADYYIWPRISSCGVIFVLLNHYYGIFSLKSFP